MIMCKSKLNKRTYDKMFQILGYKKQDLTKTQKQTLMENFQANEYPTRKERCELAMSLNIKEEKVTGWFQYMRRKAAKGRSSPSE